LLTTSCEVEVVDGVVLKGVTDGIWMDETGCSAFSGSGGLARVRAKLTCSNLHDKVTVVNDGISSNRDVGTWRNEGAGVALSCPDGTRALQCFCYSPWHNCKEMGYGYSPNTRTSCLGPVDVRHRLTMLCAHE
jgi:hypothetical protein